MIDSNLRLKLKDVKNHRFFSVSHTIGLTLIGYKVVKLVGFLLFANRQVAQNIVIDQNQKKTSSQSRLFGSELRG